MISAFIAATLGVVVYSLWVRRTTWWSRWEAAATFAVAMEGCCLVLLSPAFAEATGPTLYRYLPVWNVQHVVGSVLLIVAVVANTYHMLVRIADPDLVLPIMRKHLLLPVGLGVAVMLVAFPNIGRGFEPDMFANLKGNGWLFVYELAACWVAIFLSCYLSRLMLVLRHDARAATTVKLYAVSMAFAVAAWAIGVGSIWVGGYAGDAIWVCICLSVGIFAYGLAHSWRAKQAWFIPNTPTGG